MLPTHGVWLIEAKAIRPPLCFPSPVSTIDLASNILRVILLTDIHNIY